MKVLINDLLSLARLDSYAAKQDFLPMDLSSTVKNAALSFESLAFEYGKQFTMEIQDGLTLNGNEGNIRQLVTILLDNAFKYSGEHGTVNISLSSHGKDKKKNTSGPQYRKWNPCRGSEAYFRTFLQK